jgi:hypothetical protein
MPLVTAVVVVLALAYTLAGFFLAPRPIKTQAPRYVREQLKRRLEIGEVRVNPLLFKQPGRDRPGSCRLRRIVLRQPCW